MRSLNGDHTLVRIYIGESDTWHGRPLALSLVERLRKEGFAGATVIRGEAGFGAHSVLHTTQLLRLSQDLPVVIEVIDSDEHIERMMPILEEMVSGGLVTTSKVNVRRYSGPKASA